MTETCILLYRASLKVNSSLVKIICENLHHEIKLHLDFVGSICRKPSRDNTRPTGDTQGFNGLLHTLNAIVFPTKMDLS